MDRENAPLPSGGDDPARHPTSIASQRQRLLELLRQRPQTTDDLRNAGLYTPGARIWELRHRGYEIATDFFNGQAADGLRHRGLARYTLLAEPGGEQQ